jgi:hypothetical protein
MFVTGYGGSLFNKHDPYEKDDEEADQIYQVPFYIIIFKGTVQSVELLTVLRIRDPIFFHPGARIHIKEFKYFNPKNCFLSSRKYDPGCSSGS